jgi:hypothetical protein
LKKIRISQVRFRALLGVPILFLLCFPDPGRAATTGTTAVLQQLGSGAPTSYGDYISSAQAGGMNTFHQFYLEVPPGLILEHLLQIHAIQPQRNLGGDLHGERNHGHEQRLGCSL